MSAVVSYSLSGGAAGTTPAVSDIKSAYDEFKNTEEIDVNLMITGNHSVNVLSYVIEMAAARKDAIAFVSPHNSGVRYTTRSTMTTDIIAFKASLNVADQFQSYGVMDSGFKYIYDSYNRRYRWIPLNGDVAGICARTDDIVDPWWSPGGFNRGGVRNIIKLGFNPNQSERDILYPKGINPVVTFPGSGTILFGDRTMQEKPSAFDRINVRRLFVILEKSISIAAKYQLFEFNDSFTRAQFKNMVEPFLRDIQGRRGITDFKVICDESNNTGEIIDRNEFIADIYIKPARSINFIYLNFVATKTGVDFSTVIGG
jgi:phage tail sheath protein FI